jgi:hypothetical protein
MKPTYSPYNFEENKTDQKLFSEPCIYTTFMRLIILVVVTLLIVEVTQAQKIALLAPNSKNLIGLNQKPNTNKVSPGIDKKSIAAFVLTKEDSHPGRHQKCN